MNLNFVFSSKKEKDKDYSDPRSHFNETVKSFTPSIVPGYLNNDDDSSHHGSESTYSITQSSVDNSLRGLIIESQSNDWSTHSAHGYPFDLSLNTMNSMSNDHSTRGGTHSAHSTGGGGSIFSSLYGQNKKKESKSKKTSSKKRKNISEIDEKIMRNSITSIPSPKSTKINNFLSLQELSLLGIELPDDVLRQHAEMNKNKIEVEDNKIINNFFSPTSASIHTEKITEKLIIDDEEELRRIEKRKHINLLELEMIELEKNIFYLKEGNNVDGSIKGMTRKDAVNRLLFVGDGLDNRTNLSISLPRSVAHFKGLEIMAEKQLDDLWIDFLQTAAIGWAFGATGTPIIEEGPIEVVNYLRSNLHSTLDLNLDQYLKIQLLSTKMLENLEAIKSLHRLTSFLCASKEVHDRAYLNVIDNSLKGQLSVEQIEKLHSFMKRNLDSLDGIENYSLL